MRAKRANIFLKLLVISVFSGACSPDLARSAGALEVHVSNVPSSSQTLRTSVIVGGRADVLDTPLDVFTGQVVVDSVPAGMVAVQVQALQADVVLAQVSGAAVVQDSTRAVITLDFNPSHEGHGSDGLTASDH